MQEPGWTLETLKSYFEAILEEQRLAVQTADAEREKSAQIVRESLSRQVVAADDALAQHVRDQVQQVRLIIDANRRSAEDAFAASEKAIVKAEVATTLRFESVNEFRAQLAEQTQSFLPRETFDSILEQWTAWRSQVETRMALRDGRGAGSERTVAYLFAGIGFLGTTIGIILVVGDVLTP